APSRIPIYQCYLVRARWVFVPTVQWGLQAVGKSVEQALNTTIHVGEQTIIFRTDVCQQDRDFRYNFINGFMNGFFRLVGDVLEPTHEVLAQLIELGSQLRGHLLTLLAAITHCPLPLHPLQKLSE